MPVLNNMITLRTKSLSEVKISNITSKGCGVFTLPSRIDCFLVVFFFPLFLDNVSENSFFSDR